MRAALGACAGVGGAEPDLGRCPIEKGASIGDTSTLIGALYYGEGIGKAERAAGGGGCTDLGAGECVEQEATR